MVDRTQSAAYRAMEPCGRRLLAVIEREVERTGDAATLSRDNISDRFGISRATANHGIKQLEQLGFVKISVGAHRTNVFTLIDDWQGVDAIEATRRMAVARLPKRHGQAARRRTQRSEMTDDSALIERTRLGLSLGLFAKARELEAIVAGDAKLMASAHCIMQIVITLPMITDETLLKLASVNTQSEGLLSELIAARLSEMGGMLPLYADAKAFIEPIEQQVDQILRDAHSKMN